MTKRRPTLRRPRFTLEEKLVVQVRYYEKMYSIRDGEGERVYTGSDEKIAKEILGLLNGYYSRKNRKPEKKITRAPAGKRRR